MQENQDQKDSQIIIDVNPLIEIQEQHFIHPQQSLKGDLQMQGSIVHQSNQNNQQILESQKEISPRKSQPELSVPFENCVDFQEEVSQKLINDVIGTNSINNEVYQDSEVKQHKSQMCQNLDEIGINLTQFQVYESNPPMEIQDQHFIPISQSHKDNFSIQENIVQQNQKLFETCEDFKEKGSQKTINDEFDTNFINEEEKQHERKLSENYQPDVFNLDIHKSTTRKSQISEGMDHLSQRQPQDVLKISNLNSSYDDVLQIEQQKQPLSIYKRTPISNCFANRSQRSHRSNSNESHSSNSSYRYNRFVDTMQVPQITSLQVVKNGRETRVQRRNSVSSYHGRSASTCKKSYEDFGDFQMQKIDQSACQQVDEKSVKRSLANPTKSKIFDSTDTLNQLSQLQQQPFKNTQDPQILEKSNTEQYVYSQYIKSQEQKSQFRNKFHFDGLTSNEQFSSFNEPSIKVENQIKSGNFRQKICHEISFRYCDQNQSLEVQFDNKSIQVDNEVLQVSSKITESKRAKEQNQRKMLQRQNRIQKHSITLTCNICIQSGLQKAERFDRKINFCMQFIEGSQNLSHFGRSRYKDIILKHFEVFGIELNPIDQIGELLYHDGLFATSYIRFVKGSKSNSGMIESMLFSQFEQQIQIITNKEPFSRQYKRVKEERQMHYQNQFEKRIKIYQENKQKEKQERLNSLQQKMNQIQRQMEHTQKRVVLYDKNVDTKELENISLKEKIKSPLVSRFQIPELNSESNISVAGSNDTVTVDDTTDLLQSSIRRSATIELYKPNQILPQKNHHINHNLQQIDRMTQTLPINQKQTQEAPKKVQKSKRRSTKRKQKKSDNKIISKEKQNTQNVEQTISQVNPVSKNQISKERMSKQWKQSEKNQDGAQSFKQMKGILKISRNKKDEQTEREKRKSSNRYSVNKAQKSKLSPQQRKQNSKNSGIKVERSKQKQQENSRQKNKIKVSIDNDETDLSDSHSPKDKISMEKRKKHQNRIVKFTNSTKGGDSPYVIRLKNDSQRRENEDNKEETGEGKRSLRSRSKK